MKLNYNAPELVKIEILADFLICASITAPEYHVNPEISTGDYE